MPGMELFDLVGENWLETTPKPVAVLFGFGPWKREIVSRYLAEYRTAFARGKTPWSQLRQALDRMNSPSFIVWGMSESAEVRHYARDQNVPLYRMEDGFLRSSDLGSKHSMPLSLVLDKSGIYFDASAPSDLEQLLNSHDFSTTPQEMRAATALLSMVQGLGVSKYNLGGLQKAENILGPRLKRRVLVIGQVENDASLHFGMAEGWTNLRLIEIAREENQEAEIIYRPHPDVAEGFRRNKHTVEHLRTICRVLTHRVELADLFRCVDHVYTLTSLSGFEALMHGVPVTVVGAPFYAGWGLTDDRMPVPRRVRKLRLEEVFCAAYLLYPRYLSSTNPVLGCLSTIFRTTAERRRALEIEVTPELAKKQPQILFDSDFWPAVFRTDILPVLQTTFDKKFHVILPIPRFFGSSSGDHFQRSIAYLVAGKLAASLSFDKILHQIRSCIRPAHFASLLEDLWAVQPTPMLLDHWAWYCEHKGDVASAKKALEHLALGKKFDAEARTDLPFKGKRIGYVLKLAQFELRQRRLDDAYSLFNKLLLSGFISGEVLAGIAEIAALRFDFTSSAALLDVLNKFDPNWRRGKGFLLQARADTYDGRFMSAIETASIACATDPQSIEATMPMVDALEREVGDLPYSEAWLAAADLAQPENAISQARALIAAGRARDAESRLLAYTPATSEVQRFSLALSSAFSFQGKLGDAKQLIGRLLGHAPSLPLYREALRLAILAGDYDWGAQVLAAAEAKEIWVGDMYHRKIALGRNEIKRSYETFRLMPFHKTLKSYLGEQYRQSISQIKERSPDSVTVLACFGPGDEIRFASFYPRIRDSIATSTVTFSCDPRLLDIMERSFPNLHFRPVQRIRNLARAPILAAFDRIPGSDLHTLLDNSGWDLVMSSGAVSLMSDLLGDVIDGYDSFSGASYLVAASERVAFWKERLGRANRPLVGLSWRSSLSTYSRSEHYLSAEQLAPLFELSSVQFVNLQYDECSDELRYLEARYPGRVLHFTDLDQFNDLDEVAALMSCLDMIIAPATTVVELAGALGRPTILLSNSSELHWRKRPGSCEDVWHSSVTHVEGAVLGDKALLAQAARDALARLLPQSAHFSLQSRATPAAAAALQ